MSPVFVLRFLGALFIFLGIGPVLIAMLVTPRNYLQPRLWRMSLTLMGLGSISFGSFLVLDSTATADGPHAPAPPLGGVLGVLGLIIYLGGAVTLFVVLRAQARMSLPLAQREPPHVE